MNLKANLIINQKFILPAIIIVAFICKLLVVLFFVENINTLEVHEIALNYLRTGEMKYFLNNQINYNYQFPVYPFLVFLIYKLFGVHLVLISVLNLLLSSATAYLMYFVFDFFFNKLHLPENLLPYKSYILLSSIVLFLTHPLLSYYATNNIHPLTLDLFLTFLTMAMMVHYFKNQSAANLIFYAIALGLALLDRTTLICTAIPFVIMLFQTFPLRKSIKVLVIIALISSSFSLAWLYRNYFIYNQVSLNSSFGQNMWIGSLPETEGSARLLNGETYYSALPDSDWGIVLALTPPNQSRFFMDKYLYTLKNSPAQVAKLFFIKLKNFWFFRTNIGYDYPDQIKKYISFYKTYYLICVALALLSVFYLKRKVVLIMSFPLALSIFQSLVYVETRHRLLVEPIILFLACLGFAFLISSINLKKRV